MRIRIDNPDQRTIPAREQREQRGTATGGGPVSHGAGDTNESAPGYTPGQRLAGDQLAQVPEDYRRTDEAIRHDVEEELKRFADADARTLRITVMDGDVILEGDVVEDSARERAGRIVAGVLGVTNVENRLRIRVSAPASS